MLQLSNMMAITSRFLERGERVVQTTAAAIAFAAFSYWADDSWNNHDVILTPLSSAELIWLLYDSQADW